jgi:hypothetical protein
MAADPGRGFGRRARAANGGLARGASVSCVNSKDRRGGAKFWSMGQPLNLLHLPNSFGLFAGNGQVRSTGS